MAMGLIFTPVMAAWIFWGGYVASTLWGWFVVPLSVVDIT